jgi:hypothetical protein
MEIADIVVATWLPCGLEKRRKSIAKTLIMTLLNVLLVIFLM